MSDPQVTAASSEFFEEMPDMRVWAESDWASF
jgi:hypothetical protein